MNLPLGRRILCSNLFVEPFGTPLLTKGEAFLIGISTIFNSIKRYLLYISMVWAAIVLKKKNTPSTPFYQLNG